jgi:DNA adenine methylase
MRKPKKRCELCKHWCATFAGQDTAPCKKASECLEDDESGMTLTDPGSLYTGRLFGCVLFEENTAEKRAVEPFLALAYPAWYSKGMSTIISALVPWFGSKRTLAPRVIEELGNHQAYWENPCGSMAVMLAKPAVTYETCNDLHQDLINLALVIRDRKSAEELYRLAHPTLFAEDLCRLSKERTMSYREAAADGNIERAYWYLVFSWFHINGIAGTKLSRTGNMCIRYSAKGGNGATRWRSVVESIPDWHERLLRVQIVSRDMFEIFDELDDAAGTAIYCDPPYILKKSRYLHDFPTIEEEQRDSTKKGHLALAKALRRFKRSRVVLSYYQHPALADLYPGWTTIDATQLNVAKSMVNAGMRDDNGRTEAPECLLLNGPSLADRGLFQ